MGRSLFPSCGQTIVSLLASALDPSRRVALPGLRCASPGDLLSMFCSRIVIDSLALGHSLYPMGDARSHDAVATAGERIRSN